MSSHAETQSADAQTRGYVPGVTVPQIRDNGFRYVPVNQFTPLSNDSWIGLSQITGTTVSPNGNPWTARVNAITVNRADGSAASEETLWVQLISYEKNIFRLRLQPGSGGMTLPAKVFGPVTHDNLETLRQMEQNSGAPGGVFAETDGGLQLDTKDLTISISKSLSLTVTRKTNTPQTIFQSAADSNGSSLLATFVDTTKGNAVASAWVNNKASAARERFYGQGEVNVLGSSLTVANGGYYVVGRTGLAMTNYNYDQITYSHPELYPENPAETMPENVPNYYFPMYFSAPWIICVGNQGMADQYAFGVYLDNPSQTYTNTGDTLWGAGAGRSDTAYMGAQYGDLDLYFVFGQGGTPAQPVENVVTGLSYLTSKPSSKQTPCAAIPPKYIFGYFQGVYGSVGVTQDAFNKAVNGSAGGNISMIANATTFDDVLQGYRSCNVPLEGFAVDVDVQNIYEVFTTNGRFWTDGNIKAGKSVFDWAHENGLVTQTNITCFIRDDRPSTYTVYKSLLSGQYYTENKAAGGVPLIPNDAPVNAYNGYLQYGQYARTTAIFPDWGKKGTAEWWGPNYSLLFDLGLDFVWQDMTTPSMDTHLTGNPITQDYFDETLLEQANKNAPNPSNIDYAETFNWRSYHPQLYLTDPRYGDGAERTFAEIRNLHAYSLCQATYMQGIKKTKRTRFQRSYIIARGGQIGSQQFGGLWMGDNQSNWQDLNLMVPMVISMNLSGVSVVGADIGGFAQNDSNWNQGLNEGTPADSELMTRWIQAGALLPWFRNHYDRWLSLDPSTSETPVDWMPKQHGKPYQELYRYTDTIGNGQRYVDAMILAIELRYRWQEVLYTAAWQFAAKGAPIIEAMTLWSGDPGIDFDNKPELNSQFLLGGADGKQILVAPILSQGQTTRNVYFPKGAAWFPYYIDGDTRNLDTYQQGGCSVNVSADIGNTPVYVQAGAVLPTRYPRGGIHKSINTYTWSDPFVLDVFGITGNTYGLTYIDDGGVTTSAEDNGNYSILELQKTALNNQSAELTLSNKNNQYPWSATIFLRVRAVGVVTDVLVGSAAVSLSTAQNRNEFFETNETTSKSSYWLDSDTGSVWIAVPYGNQSTPVTIKIECADAINVSKAY